VPFEFCARRSEGIEANIKRRTAHIESLDVRVSERENLANIIKPSSEQSVAAVRKLLREDGLRGEAG
jgi:hypothetical protein